MPGGLEGLLEGWLGLNPAVARHELPLRMRGARPFLMLLVYGTAPAVVVLIMLALALSEARQGGRPPSYDTEMGRSLFAGLVMALLGLMVFGIPAYAAGAVAMEREKRALEMLRATLLSSADVVSSKLLVVLAFAGMLLVTSLPVAA